MMLMMIRVWWEISPLRNLAPVLIMLVPNEGPSNVSSSVSTELTHK